MPVQWLLGCLSRWAYVRLPFYSLKKKTKIILVIFFLGLYVTTYIGARMQNILIHRVCYQTINNSEKELTHSVIKGDFGVPMLTGAEIWRLAAVLDIIHLPLRVVESLFWNIYPREYKFNG